MDNGTLKTVRGMDAKFDRVREHQSVRLLASALESAGTPAWLVGGAVRDVLLGREPLEIDLAVEGDVAPVVEAISAVLGGETELHPQFGTARISSSALDVDLASARTESYSRPGALPEVTPAAMDADLGRRDFSINAIAICIAGSEEGKILACPRALEDLEEGIVRVLHRRSFEDDPTRLWRLARYCGRLGFEADEETSGLAEQAVTGGSLLTIGPSRNGAELLRSCDVREPAAVLELTARMGLLQAIGGRPDAIGLLDRAAGFAEGLDLCHLRILAAFAGVPDAGEVASRLQIGRAMVHAALEGSRHPGLTDALRRASMPSELRAAAQGASREAVALAGAAGAAAAASAWFERVEGVSLPFGGDALLARGLVGHDVGRALDLGLDFMLDTGEQDSSVLLAHAIEAVRAE